MINPATAQAIASVPMSPGGEVDLAVQAGQAAFLSGATRRWWSASSRSSSSRCCWREHLDEIARLITIECGKTLAESIGEMRRGIENVEVACGAPILMQGYNNEDIAAGIDEHMIRQPLGVVAAITPFNFPGMIPLWFLPYAVASGNCFILKPSEKVSMIEPEAL